MNVFNKIWKDKNASLHTEMRLAKTLVFPAIYSGSESWAPRSLGNQSGREYNTLLTCGLENAPENVLDGEEFQCLGEKPGQM